jgi:ferredoxin
LTLVIIYTYDCFSRFYIPGELKKVKVKVDPDECTGCALCVDICPEVFKMLGDLAVAKQDEVSSGTEESCMQAVEDCPVEAIIIEG